MLEHGGDLVRASRQYGIPMEQWMDLSTGINPQGYPVPEVPVSAWHRLPCDDTLLHRAAADYYETASLLPVPGTQAVIQTLPRLRAQSRVLLAALTYNEHAHAWRRLGHHVQATKVCEFGTQLTQADVLIVCNPNNPTGKCIAPQQLLEWHAALAARGGWLIVDEAYIDVTPNWSLASFAICPGLIVLRSLGKFFGLAGARVGFVFAERAIRDALQIELGPWAIAGPALFAAREALRDAAWQAQARRGLASSAHRLHDLLTCANVADSGGTALFLWRQGADAYPLYCALAQQGILTRLFCDAVPAGIRFGLPGAEAEWTRLEQALGRWQGMACA